MGRWDKALYINGRKRDRRDDEERMRKCAAVSNCPYLEFGTSNNMKRHTNNVHGKGIKPKYIGTYVKKDQVERLKYDSNKIMCELANEKKTLKAIEPKKSREKEPM